LDREVVAEAVVAAVDGRRITFEVRAVQDGVTLLHGRHVRAVVDFARFLDAAGLPAPRQPLRPERLEFWFDFHSPWCYLASHRIGALARRHGLALSWRPVHLPRLIQTIDGRRPLEQNPAFLRWYQQDKADWAELLGLPLKQHPDFPLRPARALRAACFVSKDPEMRDLMEAFLDGARVAAGAQEAAAKNALAANLEEAIGKGLFGVPSVALGEKLYFGNDRLELLELHLNGVAAPGTK
jgi:2-hydroxychromene-2-carboxylate isomerase